MQPQLIQHIPKEDPDLPDSYGVQVWYHGEKEPITLELASHTIVDKIWLPEKLPDGRVGYKFGGSLPSPYLEYKTKDDIFGIIPMTSFKRVEFDKRYSKIDALREKQRNESPKQ